ncbi:DegQ family serine endoprotease [Halioglobus maricola]|uniref:Probable periplasmic serine endoprotease DegP-like n=1 Tax=Halioglobus maricola TaxID=2601894 RepID=A0A5P9NL62_9GAMM|nr:DegQ family serine endoprotease [Halioglobus maricola]QFU76517.1 DegQ family serine endoprotease [Halioglobus maricola]
MKLSGKYSFFLTIALMLGMAVQVNAAALPDFTGIVRDNSPAVVKIIVEASGPQQGQGPQEIPEYLRRFFEFRGDAPSQQPRMGMGSGFIIDASGLIVTNDHVVSGADKVLVRMNDRREFEAEIVGTDPRSDLALLRIDAEDLPVVKLAAAGELDVGEWVLAIGSPFGLDYSVTAGIVSAKGRSLPTENGENYVPFIQTDVAINPGNSGGPLFNLDGQVVGVNSQIFTRSGGSIGLSFAIPMSVVRNVVTQLEEHGKVTRGWLGVTIQDVDKNLAESFGLERPRGALVVQVAEDGPADDAGLREGDVIISFDGRDIPASSDLPHVVGLIAPGTRVKAEIVRDRKQRTVKVEVGGLAADDSYSLAGGEPDGDEGGRIGVVVAEADAEMLERWNLSGGVVVHDVVAGSPAAEAGVRPGDVITLIGNTPVKSLDAFASAVEKLEAGDTLPLRLMRRGTPLFIGLRLTQ